MEWIASLLKTLCTFCGEELGDTRKACERCARQLVQLENMPGAEIALCDVRGELRICSAFHYQGWARTLVLRQKTNPEAPTVKWMAARLATRMPLPWRKLPLVWLPGKPLSEMHLVERLALELGALGQPLAPRQYLRRGLWPRKAQKQLDAEERKARNIREVYRPSTWLRPRKLEVLLLDDVITTGATVLGARRILEEELGLLVGGAVSLALTPKPMERKRGMSQGLDG